MFSRRAEAHDRKDTADCRPVHISAYHEHKKGGKQAIDPHIKDRSCPALSLKKVGLPPNLDLPGSGGRIPTASFLSQQLLLRS